MTSINENEITNEAEATRPAVAHDSAEESSSDLINTVIDTITTEVDTANSEVTGESSEHILEVFKEWITLEAKLEKSETDFKMNSVVLSGDNEISTNRDKQLMKGRMMMKAAIQQMKRRMMM